MSGIFLYNTYNEYNRQYATWGDIYIAILILTLGPVGMAFFVIVGIAEWLGDRADRIAFGKINWQEEEDI